MAARFEVPGFISAAIHVYTFKEGLLSRLAHDLKLSLTAFEIRARGTDVEGHFDPSSLRVLGAVRDGQLDAQALSASDRDKVQETIVREILRVREHPEIQFRGRVVVEARGPAREQNSERAPYLVEGVLTLCGHAHPLSVKLDTREDTWTGEVEFAPSRWGIKPYRALGGALKLQDRVRVTLDISVRGIKPSEVLEAESAHVFGPKA